MERIAACSEADVIAAVQSARAAHTTLEIVGAGTKRHCCRPVAADQLLDVSALAGILRYEPDELVLTARAGTTIAAIEAAIAPRDQRLGFDPADWGPLLGAPAHCATIGGVLSADACGSARVRFGACRDHLLGYRAVNGFGESYKAGGRVVKNVTGFDLSRLMCGAMGTLGVLTEVTLRLVPRPPSHAILVVPGILPEEGLALLRKAWTSPFGPTGLAFIPASAARAFPELGPFESGAAIVRVEGTRPALDEKIAGLRTLFSRACAMADSNADVFAKIGAGHAFLDESADVWRLMLPPAAAANAIHRLRPVRWLADWAGGLLWIASEPGNDMAAKDILAVAASEGGNAMLLRASPAMRTRASVASAQSGARAALEKRIKAAFDPLGIFNSGRIRQDD